jgi:hypothetical protein
MRAYRVNGLQIPLERGRDATLYYHMESSGAPKLSPDGEPEPIEKDQTHQKVALR